MMAPRYADSKLIIDLAAVARNFTKIQQMVGKAECAAVVKSNAYGLGMEQIAPILAQSGCKKFFVANLDEAVSLTEVLPADTDAKIYLLHGLLPGQGDILLAHSIIPVLNDGYQVALWQRQAEQAGRRLPAVLHIDTGLSRIGLEPSDYLRMLEDRSSWDALEIDHVMTHLACSREPDHPMNREQMEAARKLQQLWPEKPFSLSSSGGMFLGEAYYFDLIRAGCSLYGIAPTGHHRTVMDPVVTLTSRIIQVRHITRAQQTVGYNATHTAHAGDVIAVVAIGYGDGYLRSLANKAYVYVGPHRAPVVGVISMDMIAIDVTQVPSGLIYPGAEIELLGKQVLFNDVLDASSTTGYEMLARLGPRIERFYTNGSAYD